MSATSPTIGAQPSDTDDVLGRSRSHATMPPSSFWRRILSTQPSVGLTIGRLALGLILLPHAFQKVFGAFGGYGWNGTYAFFVQDLHIPGALAALAIIVEFASAIALVLGLFTRLAALGVIAIMGGAIYWVHANYGFFMNWYGQKAGEGFEYHLLAIALAVVLFALGGGSASFDRALASTRIRTRAY